jgi:phage shock protein PspC (stress-responsive transcriptional regulator)
MERRLYRSRTEKMIAGVCGGVAEYFNTDPTVIRLMWVLITLLGGAGVLVYIILWIVMPLAPPPPMR